MAALLRVQNLRVLYGDRNGGAVYALRGVNFEIQRGEIVGVLGESGCGKTTMARALARSLPKTARVSDGTVTFDGQDLFSSQKTTATRSARIVLISQEPSMALNPVLRVGDQVTEVLRAHNSWSKNRCREEAQELLGCVQLGGDPKLYDAYPHQISGGQQQRVVIAQTLACRPELLIADEPTASLDESTAAEILDLLKSAVTERKMALLLITHTPETLRRIAQRVLVMYGGRVIEEGTLTELFRDPLHPYTKALLQCSNSGLSRADTSQGVRFSTIEGDAPNLELVVEGCSFAARCEKKLSNCTKYPPEEIHLAQRKVECFLYAE